MLLNEQNKKEKERLRKQKYEKTKRKNNSITTRFTERQLAFLNNLGYGKRSDVIKKALDKYIEEVEKCKRKEVESG